MVVDRREFLSLGAAAGVGAFGLVQRQRQDADGDAGQAVDQGSGVVRYEIAPAPAARMTTQAQASLSTTIEADPFELVGVTWDRGEPTPRVEVRVRDDAGWTSWQELQAGHDPDDDARPGTDPLWVGRASAVEVRAAGADGALPAGLGVDLVQPASGSTSLTDVADADMATQVYYPRPTIYSRASWGADESLRRNQDGVWYGEVRGMFVHHTATSNDYSQSEVPAILRSIYRYHVLSREFLDIGYNFLIDKWGRIWEGAYGGVDRPVVGAHTQYYNSQSFAISAIGSFQLVQPPAAMISAYQRLISWKFTVHGLTSGYSTANYTNDNARPLPVISGHRDTKSTTCPGGNLYAKFGTLRSGVHDRVTVESSLRISGPDVVAFGQRTDLTISWTLDGRPLSGKVNLQRRSGGSWQHVRKITVTNGQATTAITPGATNSYRLRISECDTPEVDTRDPRGTSNTLGIKVVKPGDDPVLSLTGPSSVKRGAKTTLRVRWISGAGPVTGKVNLQRRNGSSWTHLRQMTIRNGEVTTVITPGGSNSYRIRASVATKPSGVPTAHPKGTSNTYTVTVT